MNDAGKGALHGQPGAGRLGRMHQTLAGRACTGSQVQGSCCVLCTCCAVPVCLVQTTQHFCMTLPTHSGAAKASSNHTQHWLAPCC